MISFNHSFWAFVENSDPSLSHSRRKPPVPPPPPPFIILPTHFQLSSPQRQMCFVLLLCFIVYIPMSFTQHLSHSTSSLCLMGKHEAILLSVIEFLVSLIIMEECVATVTVWVLYYEFTIQLVYIISNPLKRVDI